ncbi:NAD-dependent epimerase/dehydratase family protein [Mesorhizobium sp. 131-2-1]|uniref:NAD-dependent epimerase/dehydratase family protein n=1 Tax=Mesorhizobium sp. 131-2-1 TaxID=2744518 RepID=UPI001FD305F5|nr:NAD-dependent epimerase/dehydratase family protein [Mesorhizobium sp. 131-2-1]
MAGQLAGATARSEVAVGDRADDLRARRGTGLRPTTSWPSVFGTVRDNRIEAIVHSGALHKPNIEHYENSAFVATNVQGTLNLRDAAVACGVGRFVFTSTTSLMISQAIRVGFQGRRAQGGLVDRGPVAGAAQHLWRDEAFGRASVPSLLYRAWATGGRRAANGAFLPRS